MSVDRRRVARGLVFGTPRRALTSTITAGAFLLACLAFIPWPREILAFAVGIPLCLTPFAILAKAYPNEFKQASARILAHVAWASHEVERQAVKQDVEGKLGASLDRIGASCVGAVPKSVHFEFLKSGEAIRELPDGTLVVGIAHHDDWTRNLVAAAWAYARMAVLPKARFYLDPEVSQGIDFVVAKDLLSESDADAAAQFIEQIWSPAIRDRSRLQDLTLKLDRLREDFLFHTVLVAEFRDLGTRMAGRFTREDVALESAEFVDFLYSIATRTHGDDDKVKLNFRGREINVEFILVANPAVYAAKGSDPYRKAVEWSLRQAVRSVYLLCRGRNFEYAREVATSFEADQRVRSIDHWQDHASTDRHRAPIGVYRLNVDLRVLTGIGYEPQVAVGPGKQREIAEAGRLARQGVRPRAH
jgi:hypothetical protein